MQYKQMVKELEDEQSKKAEKTSFGPEDITEWKKYDEATFAAK